MQQVEAEAAVPGASERPSSPAFAPSPYAIKLEFFAGPMDLLLHLVSQQEVPIEQVKMSIVAEQYLDIVNSEAGGLDLDRAGEYLVIAATLLAIKSSSLLPVQQAEEVQDANDAFEANPFFADLKARLRAYELTKRQAQALIGMPQLGVTTFSRIDRKALQPTPEMLAEPECVHQLGKLFFKMMKRIGAGTRMLHILAEPVSVVSCMMRIIDVFSPRQAGEDRQAGEGKHEHFLGVLRSFLPLPKIKEQLQHGESKRQALDKARGVVIGSFIAVLELVKRGLMKVSQEEEADIKLSLCLRDADDAGLTSEFDSELQETAAERNKVVNILDYRASGRYKREVETGDVDAIEVKEAENA